METPKATAGPETSRNGQSEKTAFEDMRGAEAWPDFVPLTETPEGDPFPLDVFPDTVRQFIDEAANAFPCPADYLAVPLLVIAGATIGAARALAIKPGHVQRAALYAGVIGSPGSLKTPAQEAVSEAVHEEEQRLHALWESRMESYAASIDGHDADMKKWKKEPVGDPPKKPPKPVLTRLTVNDATAESLVPILKENPRGGVMLRDELTSWVQSMNQYREGGKGADQQFWLSVWSGTTATVDRKKSHELGPLRVRRPFIGVVGGLTPDKLPTLRGDRPRQRAELDGFIDRVLLSYPKEFGVSEENWKQVSPEAQSRLAMIYNKLRSLQMVTVQEGGEVKEYRPFIINLDASGRHAWQEFTKAHADERNAPDFPPHLIGPWSKLRGYCVRLALVVHYLRWAAGELTVDDDGAAPVDGADFRRAARLVAYFKSHARKVYLTMDADPQTADTRHVVKWLERHPELTIFSRHDLHRGLRRHSRFVNPENLDGPLKTLVDFGYIRALPPEPGKGRPPLPKYERNPLWTNPRNPQNPRNDGPKAGHDPVTGSFRDFGDKRDASLGEEARSQGQKGAEAEAQEEPTAGSATSPKSPEGDEEHGDAWEPDPPFSPLRGIAEG
jgi:hypothetical protein